MTCLFRIFLPGVLLLSGCGIGIPPPELAAPRPVYAIAGKIAARAENAPARAVAFEWRRLRTAEGHVDSAAFTRHGVTVARLIVSPEKVEVQTARGKVLEGENLSAEHLGIPVPVRALGFWLAGESDPSSSTRELTAPGGAVQRIYQHGWEIFYAERDSAGRPRRIEAKFPGGSATLSMEQIAEAAEKDKE